jgi:hypothetical protein
LDGAGRDEGDVSAVFFDSSASDDERRERLYAGDLFFYSPRPSILALRDLARTMVEEAFGGLDPIVAQRELPVERYVDILARLKPAFIHHPECKILLRALLAEMGCELEKVYFDVPRLRTSTSDGYLTSGIAYAFHPHRDTWYSAPQCQLNWWFPVYEILPTNAMAFHPHYWSNPIRNSSRIYNYDRWNAESRSEAAKHIHSDTRPQPRAEEPFAADPQIRLIPNPGGLILFSGAQMHSTVENTSGRTRFSVDFRTVHLDDVAHRRGAPNVDSACTGTTLRDYLRATDLAHLPEDLIAAYDTKPGPSVSSPTAANPH